MGSHFSFGSDIYGAYVPCPPLFLLVITMATRGIFLDRSKINMAIGLAMLVVLLVAGYASWKQYERHSRIKKEVAILESEKERVHKENESLKERINYFATENFQEQESKERLNMRKDNEYVVDIERMPTDLSKAEPDTSLSPQEPSHTPNYKKWWEKIF